MKLFKSFYLINVAVMALVMLLDHIFTGSVKDVSIVIVVIMWFFTVLGMKADSSVSLSLGLAFLLLNMVAYVFGQKELAASLSTWALVFLTYSFFHIVVETVRNDSGNNRS
jgi:predicted membrane protein